MRENLAKIYSAELEGISSRLIEVEVDINVGLFSFTIVGLGDKAVSEARERVSSALKNSGIKPPTRENRKITVNLAPADVKKNGSHYDLPIALGYLIASEQIKKFDSKDKIFVGELSLDGTLRPVAGIISVCRMAEQKGFKEVYIPEGNSGEASLVRGIKIFPVKNLLSLVLHLEGRDILPSLRANEFIPEMPDSYTDISEIKGQEFAKRAMMIAAAGGHNFFMSGSPGAGKTMLAQSIISILPDLTFREALEITEIYSASGLLLGKPFISFRPFRSPHHTASLVSVVGGGQNPKPGEISLAHRGVLFLDEISEFHRDVLESLRQPLEGGRVVVSRAKSSVVYPAKFILVAASNPCPCGYFQDDEKECRCSAYEVLKYKKKISGPLLDRIDIQICVNRLKSSDFNQARNEKLSLDIKNKVNNARKIQQERFRRLNMKAFSNSELSSRQIDDFIKIDGKAKNLVSKMLDKAYISARGYFKILKISQTIADIDGKEIIDEACVSEAFSYRIKEVS